MGRTQRLLDDHEAAHATPPSPLDLHEQRRSAGVPTLSVLCGPLPEAMATFRQWSVRQGSKVAIVRLGDAADFFSDWSAALRSDPDLQHHAIAVVARAANTSIGSVESLVDSHSKDAELLFTRAASFGPEAQLACAVLGREPVTNAVLPQLLDLTRSMTASSALLAVLERPSKAARSALQQLEGLLGRVPTVRIALAVPKDAYERLVGGPDCRWKSLLREGVIDLPAAAPPQPQSPSALAASRKQAVDDLADAPFAATVLTIRDVSVGRARSAYEQLLFDALEAHPQTAGLFELNGKLGFKFGPRPVEVDLVSRRLGVAIEVDGYHHFVQNEPGQDAWRRDRRKDVLLQQHGYLVMRFLAQDVVERLSEIMQTIRAQVRERRQALKEERA